jgi:signal transduction histidine kinase
MQTHTNKMARLIDDLLLHALQDLDEISLQPREQYSKPLMEALLKPLGHYVRAAGVLFVAPAELPNALIRVDAVRLEQVIANIVSNALKHTKPGDTIQLDATLEDGQFHIAIADNGAGIRPQDMPFIFERSFRGAAQESNEFAQTAGTGLGLSICQTIMEAHSGSISFSSKHGSGTIFHLYLPLC